MKKNSKSSRPSPNPAHSVAGPAQKAPAIVPPVPQSSALQTRAGGKIWLEFLNPDAKSVYVAGSFNEWMPDKTPLHLAGNGRWVGDLTVNPGRHEYLFVVDGKWTPDPMARDFTPNPFGGKNSVVQA